MSFMGCDELKVSQVGYDPEDSTEFVQKALDSDVSRIVFDRQKGPWIVRPLTLHAGKELIFEEGVELVAKRGEYKATHECLLRGYSITNLTIRGLGKGATFRMWKKDYHDPALYKKSEHRHTLHLSGAVNVLIENMRFESSGGDGILLGQRNGVPSRNVVIRKCVCDDNNRQGISAIGFDGVLVEDCVLSNTKGTAPSAGIDIEPDYPSAAICNLTMRNVLSVGNAGSGFEVMQHHATKASRPIGLRFENCRAKDNLFGAKIVANHVREHDIVRGEVTFTDCAFEGNTKQAIAMTGIPKDTIDVRFDRCSVVGCPTSADADVTISSLSARQGLPDHVEFNGLKVAKRNGADWFAFKGCGVGPGPTAIRGDVEVCWTNGTVEHVTIDRQWVAKRFPLLNGGKTVPDQLAILPFEDVRAVDGKPGEMVDLSPVWFSSHARDFLLLVTKPGLVRIKVRSTASTKTSPGQVTVRRILPDGTRPVVSRQPMPAGEGGEVSFEVKSGFGFYVMKLPSGPNARLDQANVPVAIDLTDWSPMFAPMGVKEFPLWFHVPGGEPFAAMASSSAWCPFAAEVRDPNGKTRVAGNSLGTQAVLADVSAGEATPGLWSFVFKPVPQRTFDHVRVAVGGLPGYLFLSDEKYWTVRGPAHEIAAFGARTSASPAENAKAIQAAIDAAAKDSGRVVVPAGTWRTGTLFLKSNVHLEVQEGAVLQASDRLEDYNDVDAYPENWSSKGEEWVGKHLIVARGVTNCSIVGKGVIDGCSGAFYEDKPRRIDPKATGWIYGMRKSRDPKKGRPGQLIAFVRSRDLFVGDGLTVRNSPCWCLYFYGCENVVVRDYKVRNGRQDANTDGVDIDCSRNVLVENADIVTGDDAVAIRASGRRFRDNVRKHVTENVTVRNCRFHVEVQGVRIGVGEGVIRNVRIEDCVAGHASNGVSFETYYGNGAECGVDVENVTVTRLVTEDCWNNVRFRVGGAKLDFGIRNVLFRDCTFGAQCPQIREVDERFPLKDVRFENCRYVPQAVSSFSHLRDQIPKCSAAAQ